MSPIAPFVPAAAPPPPEAACRNRDPVGADCEAGPAVEWVRRVPPDGASTPSALISPPPRLKAFAHVSAFCAVLVLSSALAGCGRPPGRPPGGPPAVGVVTLQAQPVALTTELPGRTSPFMTSDVRPQVTGIVKARLFQEGAEVRAGQPLYQIDPAPFRAAYDQAAAQLASAEAVLETDRLKAERYADLIKINGVARQDLDDAQAAYRQALATAAQDKAALETARINLAYTRVTAPIGGLIGRSSVTPGALVTADQATALATIQSLDPIYVDVVESSDDLLKLKRETSSGSLERLGQAGAPVRLILSDASEYPLEGQLKFSEVTVDPTTGSVTLRAVFPNPDGVLLPGMYVRARLTQAQGPQGVLAPQQAVAHGPSGQATAFVVGRDGRAQLRALSLGPPIGDNWLIASGLAPGDRLIVDGLMSVTPGALVRPVTIGSTQR